MDPCPHRIKALSLCVGVWVGCGCGQCAWVYMCVTSLWVCLICLSVWQYSTYAHLFFRPYVRHVYLLYIFVWVHFDYFLFILAAFSHDAFHYGYCNAFCWCGNILVRYYFYLSILSLEEFMRKIVNVSKLRIIPHVWM